ncbi:nSTAND1 domain-containing NTPase [Crossiella sp. CA198]|uniref:WD40 repeat domain-containing protein n=1 Tax=Crossiella sp. CA198 TaxID=3455607 RepID=UPI003F8D89FB
MSTLSAAAGGRQLPTLEVALAYAMACGGDEVEWTRKWRAAAAAPDAHVPRGTDTASGRAPYRGLHSFRDADADLFFGREKLVAEIADRVRANPVTFVLGASGAGKSSVLAAGVLPGLRAEGRPAVVITPGREPVANLARALGPREELGGAAAEVLVVDQFEELYTLCEPLVREDFLRGLLGRAGGPRLVLSVRADFYPRCAEHPELAALLAGNQVLVGPMNAEELRAAVSRPAAVTGLSVERALLATVAQEAKGHSGLLPLLAHALFETWRRRRGTVLTLAGFEASGGINGAVVQTAEAAYGALAPARRRLAADLLLRLLAIEEGTAVTRRQVPRAELLDLDPEAAAVLDRLAAARLVTVTEHSVEIVHEAMITAWPRLRGWIEDDRAALRLQRLITEAARTWADSGHDPSTLAGGARLELMRAHLRAAPRLNTVERSFLESSVARARQAEIAASRAARRLRVLATAAVVGALVAGLLAAVAGGAREDALAARDTALSRQIALTADKLRATDPALAAQLAIAGYRIAPTTEARSALLSYPAAPIPARLLGGAGPTALAASAGDGVIAVSNATDGSVQLLIPAEGRLIRAGVLRASTPGTMVYALALSGDDRLLAVGETTSTVALWNIADPWAPVRLAVLPQGPAGPVQRLAIAASGTEVAAAGDDGVVRWDITEPTRPRRLGRLPSDTVARTLTYNARGDRLAVGTDRGQILLWDLGDTRKPLAVLDSGSRPVPALAFSPDGRTLVSGSHDRGLRSWNLTQATPAPAAGRGDLTELKITTTAYSPDGAHLIAGSTDATIHVLDAATLATVQVLPHPDVVTWAGFTSHGAALVSVATDGALRRWPLATALPPRADTPVLDTAFTADGNRLAVFAEGSATLWDSSRPGPLARMSPPLTAPPGSAALSGAGDLAKDGRFLAAGAIHGEVHLYLLTDPPYSGHIAVLAEAREEITAVALSPDGSILAAAGRDHRVRLWQLANPRSPKLIAVLHLATDVILDLDFSPRGDRLAVASADSHVYLLDTTDAASPRQLHRLDGLRSYAYSATFNAEGTQLAMAGVDATVLLWDLTTPAPQRLGGPLLGPAGRILKLSYHPHRAILAAAVIDGTTWLWDLRDPRQPQHIATLATTGSPMNTARFRPTGDLLVAGGADRLVHRWQTEDTAVITAICRDTGDPITEQEWRTYLAELPYRPPCQANGRPTAR